MGLELGSLVNAFTNCGDVKGLIGQRQLRVTDVTHGLSSMSGYYLALLRNSM
jgi:hypothetical protein